MSKYSFVHCQSRSYWYWSRIMRLLKISYSDEWFIWITSTNWRVNENFISKFCVGETILQIHSRSPIGHTWLQWASFGKSIGRATNIVLSWVLDVIPINTEFLHNMLETATKQYAPNCKKTLQSCQTSLLSASPCKSQ